MKVVFNDITRFIDDGTTAAQPIDNKVLIKLYGTSKTANNKIGESRMDSVFIDFMKSYPFVKFQFFIACDDQKPIWR